MQICLKNHSDENELSWFFANHFVHKFFFFLFTFFLLIVYKPQMISII